MGSFAATMARMRAAAQTHLVFSKRSNGICVKMSVNKHPNGIMQAFDHIGTNGFGAQPHDFELFDMLDLSAQRRLICDGMEPAVLERLAKEVLQMPLLALLKSLKIPPSTVQRRLREEHGRLSSGESDRIARVLIILKAARDLFGNDTLAVEWIKRPLAPLGHERPIDMLDTQPGYDRVRDVLLRVGEGVTA